MINEDKIVELSMRSRFTPRELQTMSLLAEGMSTKEIAYALDRSVKTIDNYRHSLCEKTGNRGIAGITREALRLGIVYETSDASPTR